MQDRKLAKRIVDYMNELVALDRLAIRTLVSTRMPCNKAMADHPTCQVVERQGGYCVGLLGILNGLCGANEHGGGAIGAIVDDETSELHGFALVNPSEPDPDETD